MSPKFRGNAVEKAFFGMILISYYTFFIHCVFLLSQVYYTIPDLDLVKGKKVVPVPGLNRIALQGGKA